MLPVSFIRCKNEALKNCTSKASLSASKISKNTERQMTGCIGIHVYHTNFPP